MARRRKAQKRKPTGAAARTACSHADPPDDGREAQSARLPVPLDALPQLWLARLVTSLPAQAVVAVLRTCRSLRGLVLQARTRRVALTLPSAAQDLEQAVTQLHDSLKRSRTVHLEVSAPPQPAAAGAAAATWQEVETRASRLLMRTMARLGGRALQNVTAVTLTGLQLDAPTPAWLPVACPNLQQLTCSGCTLPRGAALPLPHPDDATCPQLTRLAWDSCSWMGRGWHNNVSHPGAHTELILAHLRRLPSLATLQLDDTTDGHAFAGATALVSSTLSSLTFGARAQVELAWPRLADSWPLLTRLTMRGHALRSAEVDALLRHAPRVTHLEVAGFASGFDASLQGRPCAWRELGFAGLRITSFAHLPLGALQRLWCWRPSELVVEPWACDEAHCQAVAELLGRCYTPPLVGAGAGGFQEETHVICSCSSYEEELAGVAHVLAALRPFATVHFTKIVLSALMLARLSQEVISAPVSPKRPPLSTCWLDRIKFTCVRIKADAWGALVPCCAGAAYVSFWQHLASPKEHELRALCQHAAALPRPMVVHMSLWRPKGGAAVLRRVMASLSAAGRGKLEVEWG